MTRTASASSKSTGRTSPVTEMCENCAAASYRPLTFSAAGSPANLFRRLVGGKGQKMKGGCGPSSPAWWVRWDPATSLWRTCLASSVKGVLRSSLILPRWGLMRNGVLYLRVPWELPTSEKGFSYWRTPSAQEPGWKHITVRDRHGCIPPCHPNQRFYDVETGRVVQQGLTQQVENQGWWPTPTASRTGDWTVDGKTKAVRTSLQGMAKMWPSPTRRDGETLKKVRRGAGSLAAGQQKILPLSVAVEANSTEDAEAFQNGGQLNPTWVEWLMGFPEGWTDLGS